MDVYDSGLQVDERPEAVHLGVNSRKMSVHDDSTINIVVIIIIIIIIIISRMAGCSSYMHVIILRRTREQESVNLILFLVCIDIDYFMR